METNRAVPKREGGKEGKKKKKPTNGLQIIRARPGLRFPSLFIRPTPCPSPVGVMSGATSTWCCQRGTTLGRLGFPMGQRGLVRFLVRLGAAGLRAGGIPRFPPLSTHRRYLTVRLPQRPCLLLP